MKKYISPKAEPILCKASDIIAGSPIFSFDPIAEGGKEDVKSADGTNWW